MHYAVPIAAIPTDPVGGRGQIEWIDAIIIEVHAKNIRTPPSVPPLLFYLGSFSTV